MERVTRAHSEPEANTGVGQRRDLCREKRAGHIPGELGDVTPHQAGRKQVVDGTSLTGFLFKVSILSNTAFSQSNVPPSPPPERDVVTLQETSFVLGAKRCFFNRWDVDLDGEILQLSEFCTSVAKSFELKRMYINDRCVSEAINWDSLLISSWFFISNNTRCVYGFINFGFSSLSFLAFSVPCRTSLPLTG